MATARKLPSGSWRVRVYDRDTKKTRSFTAETKKAAEKAAADWLNSKAVERVCTPTFEEAAEKYIEAKSATLSPKTIEGYRIILKNSTARLSSYPLDKLTVQLIQDWVNGLAVSKPPKTVHNIYGFVTAVLNYFDVGLSLKRVTLPRKTKIFKRLPTAEVVINTFRDSDIELPVMLAVWCGLRMSEILGIRACDIEGGVLTINQVKVRVKGKWVIKQNAKTYNSNRQTKLPWPILELIPDSDPIIKVSYDVIYKHFKREMKAQGYYITFHDLRHVNASVMAALGIPDLYAMERGGWSNTATLKSVYQQTFTEERNRVDRIVDDYFLKMFATKTCHEKQQSDAKSG